MAINRRKRQEELLPAVKKALHELALTVNKVNPEHKEYYKDLMALRNQYYNELVLLLNRNYRVKLPAVSMSFEVSITDRLECVYEVLKEIGVYEQCLQDIALLKKYA